MSSQPTERAANGGSLTAAPGARRADRLVLFGITGDLARKLVLPALYKLVGDGTWTIPITGVAATDLDTAGLRAHITDNLRDVLGQSSQQLDEAVARRFTDLVDLVPGDLLDDGTYRALADDLGDDRGYLLHYLAVPPALFAAIADHLPPVGLARDARLVVEKPFGHDPASARELDAELHESFAEEDLFRVDHYLAKEPVEDLAVLRFANPLLEPVWNRTYVHDVTVTMAERFDVADRGSFYDAVGTLRDVVQNHLLQVLAMLAMDAPATRDASALQDERVRLLRAVRTADPAAMVRGQYDGYRGTKGVAPDSRTETFVGLRLAIDNWRWSGVPFYLRAGKALTETVLEVVVTLKNPPVPLFGKPPQRTLLRFRLQPQPAMTFELLAKQPGPGQTTRPIDVGVDFTRALGTTQEAYERIFTFAAAGERGHFARADGVAEAWRIVAPLLDRSDTPEPYQPGTWGPKAADALVRGGWPDPVLPD
jgi:glucose-6-phosphate 1-dehydrogenase